MKIVRTLLMLALFGPIEVGAQIPPNVPVDGILSWYPFNGDAEDETGNGNDGLVNGATLTSDRFGNANAAYYFNGLNSTIHIEDPIVDLSFQSYTINFWMRLDDIGEYTMLTNRYGSECGYNYRLYMQEMSGLGVVTFAVHVEDSVLFNVFTAEVFAIQPNEWFMITAVYDHVLEGIEIYKDGDLWTSANCPVFFEEPTPTTLGALAGCNQPLQEFYKGDLDDIGWWNRKLTQEEIHDLHSPETVSIASISKPVIGHSIYPNPTTGIFQIDIPSHAEGSIEITDMQGRVVGHRLPKFLDGTAVVDISNLGPGSYFITIHLEQCSSTHRIVLE